MASPDTTSGDGHADLLPGLSIAAEFLSVAFAPEDWVVIRPVEKWGENGKKKSRVDYNGIRYIKPPPQQTPSLLYAAFLASARNKTNLFFDVCPRFGNGGRFELAWQIRTVRALWSDIDNLTPDQACERVAATQLPAPSLVVNSGNGAHLYWLLDKPYQIDDIGEPPEVLIEWLEDAKGAKRPRKYIREADSEERLYLDIKANVPAVSDKGQVLQDVLGGIAAVLGGDHTHDLSRLLRLPGSMNRKDERNGRPPVPCELVRCDSAQRYPFEVFLRFADQSPHKTRRQKTAAIALPTSRRMTPKQLDTLNELVANCAVAEIGARSEADWRLACAAIENGWPRGVVWSAVASVGKFAERGEAYFERTWSKAEEHTRQRAYQKIVRRQQGDEAGDAEEDADDEPEADPGLVGSLANAICEAERFAQDGGAHLYRFLNGVYRPSAESYVKSRVKRLCIETGQVGEWSSHLANEVVEFIRVDSPLLWERPPDDTINVKNGLLNVATGKLEPHSSDYLSPVQLPVFYRPGAGCPKIDKFIGEVFPADAMAIAYELPAWLMTPYTAIQKAVLLLGPGGNGKSRYLRMVEAFLGRANVANLSLHRLESDKFACARIYGKLANICSDLPSEHLAGTSIFKAITGGDAIVGEYKFKDSFDFLPFARLVFSANNPPRAPDSSDGFFDRWLVIPFERRFRGGAAEITSSELDAMLSDPAEQSGLLNRALQALAELRRTGRFSNSDSAGRAFSEFHAATDPLSVWLDNHTIEGPKLVTTKAALRVAYNGQCEREGRSPTSEKAFGSAFKRLRPAVVDGQRTVSGRVQWCYIGIGLRSSREGHDDSAYDAPLPDSGSVSHDSLDSRDSPSINLSHARECNMPSTVGASALEQDRGNRVNRVKAVNGDCPH